MITWFCPYCWRTVDAETDRCPHCGYALAEWDTLPYEEKLLRALDHALPEARTMAVQVLSELRSTAAVPRLVSLLEQEQDVYLTAEVARALARIGGEESRRALERLCAHESAAIRLLAHRLLVTVEPSPPGS